MGMYLYKSEQLVLYEYRGFDREEVYSTARYTYYFEGFNYEFVRWESMLPANMNFFS